MSYYNPEVYDPKKLLGEDAAVMEGFSLLRADGPRQVR